MSSEFRIKKIMNLVNSKETEVTTFIESNSKSNMYANINNFVEMLFDYDLNLENRFLNNREYDHFNKEEFERKIENCIPETSEPKKLTYYTY